MTPAWLQQLQQHRAIAVIRSPELQMGAQMAQAAAKGGIGLIEVTWTSDRAADLIAQLRSELPACQIGAGTLLHQDQLKVAIAAGAQFLFSPHTDPTLIELAVKQGVPMIPGALSPTEIVTAWQSGASSVKVFPIQGVGGASYIQSLRGPLEQIPLIPTGGVTVDNAVGFLQAGAVAVGLSGDLFPSQALLHQDWEAIARQARHLVQVLQPYRVESVSN
jgi:2-dehydro-3-deoxyphosphogluconate aldolase / (4S)-4-hydroxy-2-oxoglutarate aldolase